MMTRLTGALLRAILVVMTLAMPAILLPATPNDTQQIVAFMALIIGVFTFSEYMSSCPSLVSFRDSAPFNRIKFFSFAITLLVLSLSLRSLTVPTTISSLLLSVSTVLAQAVDFPYSPVRLAVLMLPEGADAQLIAKVRLTAGLSYVVSLIMLGGFYLFQRASNWPVRNGGFNVWINLPTFDPTAGGDVVDRLRRDGRINLILGFLLPFMIPAMVKISNNAFHLVDLSQQHTLIWVMTAWAFIPASLLMRGMALDRVALLISQQRERAIAASNEEHGGFLPA
ncbi:MAG: hypothetical protein JKX69_04015 [Rhodobacteraceae bacterium]|nr:hypothetical protein [Paracoccaceae bacterium]